METTQLDARSMIQLEALNAWKENNYMGTINLPTGVGKTRVLVTAAGSDIQKNPEHKWLVVVPRERLRDVEIPNEFKKWGYWKEFKNNVTVECIQSARNREGEKWDGVCVDEVHNTLSPENKKLYENNEFKKIICLSATIEDEDKQEYLFEFAPRVYSKSVKEALALGLISDYRIYNLAVPFTEDEQKAYNRNQVSYIKLQNMLGGKRFAFNNASKYLKEKGKHPKDKVQNAVMFYAVMRKRKKMCYEASGKIEVTKQLQRKFAEQYGLFFCESIDFAEAVAESIGDYATTFHSKLGKKARAENMKAYTDARTKVKFLSTAKALNEGFNLERCSYAVCGSGSSKQLDQIQRLGRTVRLQEGKVAIFVNLYVPDTQEEKWVTSRTEGQDVRWITDIEDVSLD
jgi:superfamily II DNA or RNA helicase